MMNSSWRNRTIVAACLGILMGCSPKPPADVSAPRKGNVFLENESVFVTIPNNATWTLNDYDGRQHSNGYSSAGKVAFEHLPVGWYEMQWTSEQGSRGKLDLSVLLDWNDRNATQDSPVGIDAGLFYIFYRSKAGSLSIDYTPEDVAELLSLARVSWVRDRLWWKSFDYASAPDQERGVPDRVFSALHASGLNVLTVVYGAPSNALPQGASSKKPPIDLLRVYDYFKSLAVRFPDVVTQWETWNEPEGIGGSLLSYEIAALQKAAYLGLKSQSPSARSSMGMGHIRWPESLYENAYTDFIDTYNIHEHGKDVAKSRSNMLRVQPFTGGRPVWLTENSMGSYAGTPDRPGEMPLPEARKQAEAIPKLFMRNLLLGIEKVFYFYLFSHTEESGKLYGLVRETDLTPRPGFNALATVGRLLGNVKAVKPLNGLPGNIEGYVCEESPSPEAHDIHVLWSNDGNTWTWEAPIGSEVFDVIGRRIRISGNRVPITPSPVYVTSKQTSAHEPKVSSRDVPTAHCPVIISLNLDERYKDTASDSIIVPCDKDFLLPLKVYNLGKDIARGQIMIECAETPAVYSQSLPVQIGPGECISLDKTIHITRRDLTGAASFSLKVSGSFESVGHSVLAVNLRPQIRNLDAGGTLIPIKSPNNQSVWKPALSKQAKMTSSTRSGWTIFEWIFGPPENQVVGHVWAAPSLNLPESAIPQPLPDGIAVNIRQISGPKLKLAINVVEENGAGYVGYLDVNEDELRSPEGVIAVVPFSGMTNPGFRKQDDNGTLDVAGIRVIEIAGWTDPNSKVELALRNLNWVIFSKPGN